MILVMRLKRKRNGRIEREMENSLRFHNVRSVPSWIEKVEEFSATKDNKEQYQEKQTPSKQNGRISNKRYSDPKSIFM